MGSAVCDSQVAKLSIPVKSRLYLEHRAHSEPIYLAFAEFSATLQFCMM